MIPCPWCNEQFDQGEHTPVVSILFSRVTVCQACSKKHPTKIIDGREITVDYVINYNLKGIIESYNQQKASVNELIRQKEEKEKQRKELEDMIETVKKATQIRKAELEKEIMNLQSLRKAEDPTCTEWIACSSCFLFTNAEKLLTCCDCDRTDPICATCIYKYHKHEQKREMDEKFNRTIELEMSTVPIDRTTSQTGLFDSSIICLDTDQPMDSSIVILE